MLYLLADGCAATMQEMKGDLVATVQHSGTSDPERDTSCCSQCNANPECEFWVRSTANSNCFLKKGFTYDETSGFLRGAFRSSARAAGVGKGGGKGGQRLGNSNILGRSGMIHCTGGVAPCI